jgi:hypothetical protein
VSAKDLKSPVLVFEENPGLCESWQWKQYVWSGSKGLVDRVDWVVTYVSITWRSGNSLKPSDLQQFCWCVWLN